MNSDTMTQPDLFDIGPAPSIQSPLEEHLMYAYQAAGWIRTSASNDNDPNHREWWHNPGIPSVGMTRQFDLRRWRVDLTCDFYFTKRFYDGSGKNRITLIVEVDGWQWHSDKKQVRRDRKNERDMLAAGMSWMRFPGADLLRPFGPEAAVLRTHEELATWTRSAAPLAHGKPTVCATDRLHATR